MRDVIIIGAGGGGPVVAKELAARGVDVLLLEAGPRFADPEKEWTHFDNDATNPVYGYFRFGPADRTRPAWLRDTPQPTSIQQVAGVGGTTLHYYGNCPRAMPGVFTDYNGTDAARYDTAHLFPFGYRDLIPYYEWVEQTLPVQTAPMGTKEAVFYHGAERLGLPVQTTKDTVRASFRPQENCILQPQGNAGKTTNAMLMQFPMTQGCTFCGHCNQGCFEPRGAPRHLKAKRSTDNSYIPLALSADEWARGGKAITLVANAFVTRIDTDNENVARSVTWRDGASGSLSTDEARVIVLAAGAIESPRLWLNSGLPNPNGQVGRGLTDHMMDLVVGTFPFYTGASRGPASAARADFPGYGCMEGLQVMPSRAAMSDGFSDAGISGFYDNGFPGGLQGADTMGRLTGPGLKTGLAQIDATLGIAVITDDDVEDGNRVMLSTSLPPDEHGPVAHVEVGVRRRSARTLANRELLVGQAVKLLRAAGAIHVHRVAWSPVLIHIHSPCAWGPARPIPCWMATEKHAP